MSDLITALPKIQNAVEYDVKESEAFNLGNEQVLIDSIVVAVENHIHNKD
jgi:hypothetical protein